MSKRLELIIPDDVWQRVEALSPLRTSNNNPLVIVQTAINVGIPMLEAFTFGSHRAWRTAAKEPCTNYEHNDGAAR